MRRNLLFFDEVEVDGHGSLWALGMLLHVASVEQHFLIVDDAYPLLLDGIVFLLLHRLSPGSQVILVPWLTLRLGSGLSLLTSFIASFFLVNLLLSAGALGSCALFLLLGGILGGFLRPLFGSVTQFAWLQSKWLLVFLRQVVELRSLRRTLILRGVVGLAARTRDLSRRVVPRSGRIAARGPRL